MDVKTVGLYMENNQGFSLIEVLVTMVLIAIGVLGMVTLQNKSIQFTQDAANRNAAVNLANELVEIMRSHRDDFYKNKPPIYHFNTELKQDSDIYNSDGSIKFSSDNCPAQKVSKNLQEQASCWLKLAEENLPGNVYSYVKYGLRVCPSFKTGECAGNNYKGSSLELNISWYAKSGECIDSSDETKCTYTVRVEL